MLFRLTAIISGVLPYLSGISVYINKLYEF